MLCYHYNLEKHVQFNRQQINLVMNISGWGKCRVRSLMTLFIKHQESVCWWQCSVLGCQVTNFALFHNLIMYPQHCIYQMLARAHVPSSEQAYSLSFVAKTLTMLMGLETQIMCLSYVLVNGTLIPFHAVIWVCWPWI